MLGQVLLSVVLILGACLGCSAYLLRWSKRHPSAAAACLKKPCCRKTLGCLGVRQRVERWLTVAQPLSSSAGGAGGATAAAALTAKLPPSAGSPPPPGEAAAASGAGLSKLEESGAALVPSKAGQPQAPSTLQALQAPGAQAPSTRTLRALDAPADGPAAYAAASALAVGGGGGAEGPGEASLALARTALDDGTNVGLRGAHPGAQPPSPSLIATLPSTPHELVQSWQRLDELRRQTALVSIIDARRQDKLLLGHQVAAGGGLRPYLAVWDTVPVQYSGGGGGAAGGGLAQPAVNNPLAAATAVSEVPVQRAFKSPAVDAYLCNF